MPTLGAYIIARNEADLLEGCVQRILPFVDELLLINHGSTDATEEIMDRIEKIEPRKVVVLNHDYIQPIDMGKLRTICYQNLRSDWVLNVDADEYYPKEAMERIKEAIENANGAISFRVRYYNVSWRPGWYQANFDHSPDRLYHRDAVDYVGGKLPDDMHHVKKEYYQFNSVLEYDNASDRSFENPKQPILQDVWYYHLARTRGYHFEYKKWFGYQKNLHPDMPNEEARQLARKNQWVSGLYMSTKFKETPHNIPMKNISNPKISVIIPNFNYGQYIGDAIESVFNQTKTPFEIIVVDDGSTDDSLSIIQKYPVTLLTNAHAGVATARNAGIAKASGDYFLCLDSDDKLVPQALEKMLNAMQGDVQVVYPNLRFIGDQEGVWDAPEPSMEAMRAWQIVPSVCALIDRHCFDISGGFDPAMIYEDWAFFLDLMIRNNFTFAHVPEYLLEYRKHGQSLVNENDKQQAKGFQQLREKYGITRT